MYRKRYTKLFISLFFVVVFVVMASFSLNAQIKHRDKYFAIKNGGEAKATIYQDPDHEYKAGVKSKYIYTFTVNGKTYTAMTMGEYLEEDLSDVWIMYALDGDDVRLDSDELSKALPGGQKYPIALSWEKPYFKNQRQPSLTMAYAMFFLGGIAFLYLVYNVVYLLLYKNLETKGTLTYGFFIEAFASKAGSNRYMAVRYKFQDENENWIEAQTPFTYNTLDAERLMALGTFKIRYRGKRSMIAENVKTIRL